MLTHGLKVIVAGRVRTIYGWKWLRKYGAARTVVVNRQENLAEVDLLKEPTGKE